MSEAGASEIEALAGTGEDEATIVASLESLNASIDILIAAASVHMRNGRSPNEVAVLMGVQTLLYDGALARESLARALAVAVVRLATQAREFHSGQ